MQKWQGLAHSFIEYINWKPFDPFNSTITTIDSYWALAYQKLNMEKLKTEVVAFTKLGAIFFVSKPERTTKKEKIFPHIWNSRMAKKQN